MASHPHNFPKLHNAAWPGVVGKGPDSEPPIDLDTMLDLTAAAEVDGVKFDGVDLFLYAPHVEIDVSDDDLKQLADKARRRNLVDRHGHGAGLAPHRRRLGHGNRRRAEAVFDQVRKGCHIARRLRELGVRPYGIVRIDSACSVSEWAQGDPNANSKRHCRNVPPGLRHRRGCRRTAGRRRRNLLGRHAQLAADGAAAGNGRSARARSASRPTWPTRCSYVLGYNAPEDAILPENFDWNDDTARLEAALKQLTAALRPWTIDFHVAQNDATVYGSGSHDKTGRHCLPGDPNGKLGRASQCRLLAARRARAT